MLPLKVATKVVFALAALAISSAVAAPATTSEARQDGKTLGAPKFIPSIFSLIGPAANVIPLSFTMHLESADLSGLATYLNNPQNGPLTQDQLAKYATPSVASLSAVQDFLKAQGFKDSDITYSSLKDEVTVVSNVGQASKLFAAQFSTYHFFGDTVPRTKQYTIPAAIADAVT